MNSFQILVLKSLRKAYQIIFGTEKIKKLECIEDADLASNIIFDALSVDKPCMIGRFGAFELAILINYLGILKGKNILGFIRSKQPNWWWHESLIISMNTNAGFFPPTHEKIEKFCRLMLDDIHLMDVLGSWLPDEFFF